MKLGVLFAKLGAMILVVVGAVSNNLDVIVIFCGNGCLWGRKWVAERQCYPSRGMGRQKPYLRFVLE